MTGWGNPLVGKGMTSTGIKTWSYGAKGCITSENNSGHRVSCANQRGCRWIWCIDDLHWNRRNRLSRRKASRKWYDATRRQGLHSQEKNNQWHSQIGTFSCSWLFVPLFQATSLLFPRIEMGWGGYTIGHLEHFRTFTVEFFTVDTAIVAGLARYCLIMTVQVGEKWERSWRGTAANVMSLDMMSVPICPSMLNHIISSLSFLLGLCLAYPSTFLYLFSFWNHLHSTSIFCTP